MGLNTTVLILNDALPTIEGHPLEFTQGLVDSIQRFGSESIVLPVAGHANPVTIIETHHADDTVVIAVGGNCASIIGYVSDGKHVGRPAQIRLLEGLLKKLKAI